MKKFNHIAAIGIFYIAILMGCTPTIQKTETPQITYTITDNSQVVLAAEGATVVAKPVATTQQTATPTATVSATQTPPPITHYWLVFFFGMAVGITTIIGGYFAWKKWIKGA